MSNEKFEIRHSIRTRLLLGFLAIISGMIAFLLIFNAAFSEMFYENSKKRDMREAYTEIAQLMDEYDRGIIDEKELENQFDNICLKRSLTALTIESDWSASFSNVGNYESIVERLQQNLMSDPEQLDAENIIKLLEKNENYVLQKFYDIKFGDEVVELYGTLPTGQTILLRVATASIKDTMSVMNTNVLIVGLLMLGIAILFALFLSSYIAKPIHKLSEVAKKMSVLDFNAKYTGHDTSEIGLLGQSMNEMSQELENTITKLKSANLELQNDIENKQKIQQRQKEFLSDVSHELKTPIALIEGYAEALKDGIASDEETRNEYCDIIIDEAGKMNTMVKQLLTINQIETGRSEIDIERFDIVKMILSLLNSNSIKFKKAGINVEFDQKDEHIEVFADALKTEQVLTNFITNAINHCKYDKRISVLLEMKGDIVRVHVKNTGDNIPDDQIGEIWNKFYKVDKARSREYGGNGIGLSIVKAIMDQHGRECGVDNTVEGVDFWFELDCKKTV